jgi:CMP-N-acetylneuraminic acid synthetase
MIIAIPARKGSKGLPFKNRKLFRHTADIIPKEMSDLVYVITDDTEIATLAEEYKFNVVIRPAEISTDTTSTKEVMQYLIPKLGAHLNSTICMLYLTYPNRTWKDVMKAWKFAFDNNADSMLCKKEVDTSPFLMLKEEDDNRGSQLFYHNLYRRQDYSKCFEISHFIAIFRSTVLNKLNDNLYNSDTVFMEIKNNVIDVDTQQDLDKLDES